MTPSTRNATKHTKARTRRRLTAQERLARDCRQAQHATEALQQALDDLGLPEDLVTEIGPVTTFLSSGIVEHLKNVPILLANPEIGFYCTVIRFLMDAIRIDFIS
jgi:hypothetical protein